MANCDSFLRDKFKLKGYPNKSQALSDAKTALEQYKTLKPIFKNCSLPDGHNKELLCLDGTIPVNYRGSTYNIPISIWLQEKHPYIAPFAHVVPTAEMEIKPGRHVDAHGRVYLPFLTEWKY
ncbi:tumor susceptibility gene 101 isoform X2, partial [Paramuricea clavata]